MARREVTALAARVEGEGGEEGASMDGDLREATAPNPDVPAAASETLELRERT